MYSSIVAFVTRIGAGSSRRCCRVRCSAGGEVPQRVRGQRVRRFAVVQAEPDGTVEGRRPRTQPVALTVDQRVERVQEERPHPRDAPAGRAFARELVEYRYQETLGLPRSRAARHQHRSGRFFRQQPPATQLVFVRTPIAAEAMVGAVGGRVVHRGDEPWARVPPTRLDPPSSRPPKRQPNVASKTGSASSASSLPGGASSFPIR